MRAVSPLIIALAAALLVPLVLPGWLVFLFTVALAKSIVVIGVLLLLRGDLVSFGHALYYATGAYTTALLLRSGLLPVREALLLVVISALVAAALAAVVGLFLARYRGIFFGMLTTAFTMILYSLLLKLYEVTGGTDGLSVRSVSIFMISPDADTVRPLQYLLVLVIAVGALFVARRLSASPLGYVMRAIWDNEVRVEYMGASVRRAIYRTYVFTGALGGVGGALAAICVGHVAPDLAYWTSSAEFVFVALLGGTASVFAPVIGSIVFELVRNYAFKLSPYTWQMLVGAVLLAIILFAPSGLWGLATRFLRSGGRWPRFSRP
jgi:branched-chain amino acid transport system permease protein